MVQIVYATIFALVVTYVQSQYFDFFSAFQPVAHQTLRPFQIEVTTKRPKLTNTHHKTTFRPFFETEDTRERDKQRQKEKTFSTTAARTEKSVSSHRVTNTHVSKDSKHIIKTERPSSRDQGTGRLVFDNGKTNVIDYERPEYASKRPFTPSPYTSRPGVRPIVGNGPPITNKPPTRQTFGLKPDVDTSVSPELIIGPNDDYMSAVDKKRYIEIAERMCDRYKDLNVKQIQAIPLVPSPEVLRVNVSTCTPTTVPLVVGGKVVTVQDFPHMALLGWPRLQRDGYSWKCGGSLISDRYVLTAAHCAYQDRDNSVVTGAPRVVQLGSSYMDDQNAVVMKVSAVVRHPKYKLPKSYYDIAIVKMSSTVTFSKQIKPACLGVPPPPGDPVIATGWGRTEFGGDQSHELRSVSLPVWDMSECSRALGTSRKIPDGPSPDSQICAGEKRGGKDTCQGDSGGPAQIQDGCIWRVVAVTSLGRSCGAPQTPALYAKVQRAFISAVVFGDQENNNKPTTKKYDINNRNPDYYNQNSRTTESSYKINERNQNSRTEPNQNYDRNQNSRNYGYSTESNRNQNNYYNQNYNNNAYTTTGYNKPRNYNDYGESDYQSDDNSYYNRGRPYWT